MPTVPKKFQNFYIKNWSFSHKDTRWVSDVFMRHKKRRSRRFDLEKEHGFRLVIHERDWIAGRTIRANITDSIEKSRRVIFIISRYPLLQLKNLRFLLHSSTGTPILVRSWKNSYLKITMWPFSFWHQHECPPEIVQVP